MFTARYELIAYIKQITFRLQKVQFITTIHTQEHTQTVVEGKTRTEHHFKQAALLDVDSGD